MVGCITGSISVMRGYIAKISAPDDRAVAVSMFGLATMFAVTIGPGKIDFVFFSFSDNFKHENDFMIMRSL